MTRPIVLRPPLGDGREYIFAADLFDALVAATAAVPPARLRLTRLTDEAVELRHDAPCPEDPGYAGSFDHAGAPGGWLRRIAADRITARLAPRDADLLAGATRGADVMAVRLAAGGSVAGAALVLAVALLRSVVPAHRWNLAELRADGPLAGPGLLEVRLGRRFGRFQLIAVHLDDQPWGLLTLATVHTPQKAVP